MLVHNGCSVPTNGLRRLSGQSILQVMIAADRSEAKVYDVDSKSHFVIKRERQMVVKIAIFPQNFMSAL